MANRFRDTTETFTTRWITLGQACKLLGVNESTLRRWADAGHVRSFRTPGGHRRFSEDDLHRMTEERGGRGGEPYASLGQVAVTRIRRRLERGRQQAPWYAGISDGGRERLGSLGRRLLALVTEFKTKGTRRSQLIDEAREIGHEYGRELVSERLGIRDAVEAFTFFRKELEESAQEQVQKDDSLDEAVEIWGLLSNLDDQVLLAIAETYEEAQTPAVSG